MNIALIAHDAKKELMVQFCIAYCGILSRHNICATGTTGKLVQEATGLTLQRYLTGSAGGGEQIAAAGVPIEMYIDYGYHDWTFWRHCANQFLRKLFV